MITGGGASGVGKLTPDQMAPIENWLARRNPMRASDVASGASDVPASAAEPRMQDSASGSIAVDNEDCLSVGCENAAQSNEYEGNLEEEERRNAEKYLDFAREKIKGTKLDKKLDDYGRTGVMIAGRYGDLELMREYLEQGANIFKTAGGYSRDDVLTETLRGGNEGCISLLLDQPGAVDLVERDKNKTLLSDARRMPGIVERLIKMGADVNARDGSGYTALHWSAYYGFMETVKILIDNGANVEAKTGTNVTPLIFAQRLDIAKMLIDAGANIDHMDDQKYTPLLLAIFYGRLELANLLLDNGANPRIVGGPKNLNALQYMEAPLEFRERTHEELEITAKIRRIMGEAM